MPDEPEKSQNGQPGNRNEKKLNIGLASPRPFIYLLHFFQPMAE